MDEQIKLEGQIENIIFYNESNAYCVFSLSPSAQSEEIEIVCVGYIPNLLEGENLSLYGNYILHPIYGRQLNIEYYERVLPNSLNGMVKYLGSGIIKGVGPKLSKKIVAQFGEKTFDVIEQSPELLTKIKGITHERAYKISGAFHSQMHQRQAVMFLQEFGVSPNLAAKIYKQFKEHTIDIVKKNPYALADQISGIGFKIADKLAQAAGIQADSPKRIKAAIRYTLQLASQEGHTYLPKDVLIAKASEILEISISSSAIDFDGLLIELQLEKSVYVDNTAETMAVYSSFFYYAEKYSAQKLIELSVACEDITAGNTDKEISKFEKDTKIILHKKQKEAVKEVLTNGVTVITGGPGTGKTTIINTVISMLNKYGLDILLAAPTGRAAKRMTEATGMEAKTIHRLLEISFMDDAGKSQSFGKNEDNPLEADVVIIDESSMVDILLMRSLLKAIPSGTRLILVGDVDQLPSVGPGNVLKDVIKSEKFKVIRLTEVFRQAQQSAIVMNAHRINSGIYPELNDKESDFFFIKKINVNDLISTIIELVTTRLPKFLNCNVKSDIQILTPTRKGSTGVQNLNTVLQQAINPPALTKMEKEVRNIVFREGDKVMQVKNNYNTTWRMFNSSNRITDEGIGVFNGDEGIITEINDTDETVTVKFADDKVVYYDYSALDELELSYAVTIHKSQGSEYTCVVIPVHSAPSMLLTRNLLYTAITRAKRLVVIVGVKEILFGMVDNSREFYRYSSLITRIKE